ncbi:MAG: L-sorbosone dehydrogenase [Deltaproteobacteria bacterium]|nr:L-sorbosone dehydrogenase [Deltaproteobacteria bacterium]
MSWRIVALSFGLVLLFVFSGCFPVFVGEARLDHIKLPPGFRIDIYANDADDARSMALGTRGTLFVGTRRAGKVYAITDRDGDGKADGVVTIASGLNIEPHSPF